MAMAALNGWAVDSLQAIVYRPVLWKKRRRKAIIMVWGKRFHDAAQFRPVNAGKPFWPVC
jgi:hypothetical protein